jgi:hypothetical protein
VATPGEANGTNRRHGHSILLHSNQAANTTDCLANLRPTRSARASQRRDAAHVTKAQTVICLLCSRTQTTVPDCLGHPAEPHSHPCETATSDLSIRMFEKWASPISGCRPELVYFDFEFPLNMFNCTLNIAKAQVVQFVSMLIEIEDVS